jgi:formate hydrogenlyase subunit 4
MIPTTIQTLLVALAQIAFFIVLAPANVSVERWMKARLQLRRGNPPLQAYYNLYKLLRKPSAPSAKSTSWVFRIAPSIIFVCSALLGWYSQPLPLPLPPLLPKLDLVTVVLLLGLARFMHALAGMDIGSSFGGMGSSRKMFLDVLIEPVLILIALSAALFASTPDLASSISPFAPQAVVRSTALVFVWLAVARIALIDIGLLPIDNLSSPLELTMVHHALNLEYSGKDLALIEWGDAMRLTFYLILLGNLLIAGSGNFQLFGIPIPLLFLVKFFLTPFLLALFEIVQVKMRWRYVVTHWAVTLMLGIAGVSLAVIK